MFMGEVSVLQESLLLIPSVLQVLKSGRLSSPLRLGENRKKVVGPIPTSSGVPLVQMGISLYEDLSIVGDPNIK